jgi:hypothetical protein
MQIKQFLGEVDMSITGFSNERTSGYMILNDLYNKIQSRCRLFYPFYYHKRRDDTHISLMNDPGDIQIVACFARRPKTDSVLSSKTIISFRRSIFDQVDFLEKFDIPVIAGTPLGTGIENIGFGSKCQWFQVHSGIEDDYIEYRFRHHIIEPDCLVKGIRLLDDTQIHRLLLSTPKYNWSKIIELIQTWSEAYSTHYFMYHNRNLFNTISGIKPVFIVYDLCK